MAELPHLRYPFQFVAGRAAVVEQDSIDEVAQCAEVILRYPTGLRIDLPEFGTPEQVLRQSVDEAALADALGRWEPRAAAVLQGALDTQDELVRRVRIALRTRAGS